MPSTILVEFLRRRISYRRNDSVTMDPVPSAWPSQLAQAKSSRLR
jgi:hypothetical protein